MVSRNQHWALLGLTADRGSNISAMECVSIGEHGLTLSVSRGLNKTVPRHIA